MNWQPISTAPRNRVILTNEGTACWYQSFLPTTHLTPMGPGGWFLCTTDGHIPECAEDGLSISSIEPTQWLDIPLTPEN